MKKTLLKTAYEKGSAVAILPVGSVENHGILPLGTDTLIAECITNKALEKASCDVEALPVIPYSVSLEHAKPRATSSPQTFITYLVEIVESLLEYTNAVIIAVFHGGAYPAAYLAARALRSKGFKVTSFNAWRTVESYIGSKYDIESGIIHADAVEASLLLACGHRVGIKEASIEEVIDSLRAKPGKRVELEPWIYSDLGYIYPKTPVPASKEFGEELLELLASELADKACKLVGQ
ncbi:creatininase family protein [Pyrofollis japonicus]|uniref:creatininase family protein n=1 Tax=Pyrofollis japonicus TaxID=3060460 RepID=UPI00295AFDB2|nr:creatininase family protein [Pyrofollis japonicus]